MLTADLQLRQSQVLLMQQSGTLSDWVRSTLPKAPGVAPAVVTPGFTPGGRSGGESRCRRNKSGFQSWRRSRDKSGHHSTLRRDPPLNAQTHLRQAQAGFSDRSQFGPSNLYSVCTRRNGKDLHHGRCILQHALLECE